MYLLNKVIEEVKVKVFVSIPLNYNAMLYIYQKIREK
jgi:hypothetical protein